MLCSKNHLVTEEEDYLVALLIHSANPQSRPVGIIVLHMSSVRPSVPIFHNLTKKQIDNNVLYWRDCGSGRVDHW